MDGQLKQMQNETRPWIGFEENGVHTEPIVIGPDGAVSTLVTTTIRNFANYPGSVPSCTLAELVVTDLAHGSSVVSERLNRYMASTLPRGYGPSHILFPGGRLNCVNSTFVTPSQIVRGPNGGNLEAYLVGGIVYTDSLGNLHHTSFSYLYQAIGTIPRSSVFELTPGIIIPAGVWIEHRTLVD